jgi:hypothetical protein
MKNGRHKRLGLIKSFSQSKIIATARGTAINLTAVIRYFPVNVVVELFKKPFLSIKKTTVCNHKNSLPVMFCQPLKNSTDNSMVHMLAIAVAIHCFTAKIKRTS